MRYLPIILLLALMSCQSPNSPDLNFDSVRFSVENQNYALGDTVKAVLQNEGSFTITCGNPFKVEQKIDGRWKLIGPTGAFTLEAYRLSTGDQKTYSFALADSTTLFPDHSFTEGEYRITTDVEKESQNESYSLTTSSFKVIH